MCPYSELFWSVFSCVWTGYGEIRMDISPYLARMEENADQDNSEYGHFSRGVYVHKQGINHQQREKDHI